VTEAITTARYTDGLIQEIETDLAHLERITPAAVGPAEPGRDAMAARPGCRVITAAIAGRLAGFVLCLPGDVAAEPGPAAGADLDAGQSQVFTGSGLRVHALVVAPAARGLGVSEQLLDAARREQADGRVFAVLPADHPGNRVARAAGWHEVMRTSSGMQLLLHPDHPALAAILLRA
jgi:GNAT superfamily N-acetyltransferase